MSLYTTFIGCSSLIYNILYQEKKSEKQWDGRLSRNFHRLQQEISLSVNCQKYHYVIFCKWCIPFALPVKATVRAGGRKAVPSPCTTRLVQTAMTTAATSWDDIPSLENLEVDWEFEPENALGKRLWSRFGPADLQASLDIENIPVKVVGRQFSSVGKLLDISRGGLAVLLDKTLASGQPVRVAFLLGQQKVVSTAIIRNVTSLKGQQRIGMEFIGLGEEISSYIAGLISSKTSTI